MTPYYLKCLTNEEDGRWIDLESVSSIEQKIGFGRTYDDITYWLKGDSCYGFIVANYENEEDKKLDTQPVLNDFIEAWKQANTKECMHDYQPWGKGHQCTKCGHGWMPSDSPTMQYY